jgi:DNA-binding LacI/PurR family transcriptional regulator
MAARCLYGKGHRDIGIAYARNHRPFKLRKDGFSEALSAFGLAPSALGAHRPSAYFCANDEIAVALYKAPRGAAFRFRGTFP